MNKVLKYISLRCSADDGIGQTFEATCSGFVDRPLNAERWFGLQHVGSVKGKIYKLRVNIDVQPCSDRLDWPLWRIIQTNDICLHLKKQ